MCDPVTMTTLAVASTGISLYAQHESAEAQADAIEAQEANEREEARERAEEEIGQRVRQAREARARALVAAGESGAMGQSFAVAMNQALQDQDMDTALVSKNLAHQQRAISDKANTARSQIRDPSAIEAGLQLATAGVSGYNTGLSLEARRKARTSGGP